MTAAHAGTPATAYGIDFINEHNGRGQPLGLLKQVPHTAGAHAHIQLQEIGAGNGQELHPRLTGHSPGQEGLAGTRRAHQQHALGHLGTHLPEPLRLAQEVHHLLQLLQLLVHTGHIPEGDIIGRTQTGLGPGKARQVVAAVLGTHHGPDQQQQHARQKIGDGLHKHGGLRVGHKGIILQDPLFQLGPEQISQILPQRLGGGVALHLCLFVQRPVQLQVDGAVPHHKVLHLLLFKERYHLGIGQGRVHQILHRFENPGEE